MWSHELAGNISWVDIDHAEEVGYDIVILLSGHLLLCEVRATNFHETSIGSLH